MVRFSALPAGAALSFFVYPWEWWHFDWKDWRDYPVLDIGFDLIPRKEKKE